MNVLQISSAADSGGAGVAMARLHHALNDRGHQSHIVARLRRSPQPGVLTLPEAVGAGQSPAHRFLNNARMQLDAWFGLPQVYRSTEQLLDTRLLEKADVINLHNLHGFYFNYEWLPEICRRKPVVWTLHDMWALTGHCAYSYDCERWQTGCFSCPLLRGKGRRVVEPRPTLLDRTSLQWQSKQDLYQRSRLHVVTPSLWLADQVHKSALGGALSIQSIPNGVDLSVFRPREQAFAREVLGIRHGAKVILFVAAKVTQGRKGLAYLYKALQLVQQTKGLVLLTVGSAGSNLKELPDCEQIHLGQLSDQSRLNLAYCAADLYVLPTLADNQPLTVVESLASGTPTVCFDIGGLPEMVRHLETGYLASYKDAADLATGMRMLLEDDELRARMRQNCRDFSLAHYALEEQAERYVELYERAVRAHQPLGEGTDR